MFKSFAHFAGLSAGSRLRLLLSEFFSWFPKPSRGRLYRLSRYARSWCASIQFSRSIRCPAFYGSALVIYHPFSVLSTFFLILSLFSSLFSPAADPAIDGAVPTEGTVCCGAFPHRGVLLLRKISRNFACKKPPPLRAGPKLRPHQKNALPKVRREGRGLLMFPFPRRP